MADPSAPEKKGAPLPEKEMAPKTIDKPSVCDPAQSVNHEILTYSVHARDLRGNLVCFYVDAQDEAGVWQEAQERRGVGAVQSVQELVMECGRWH